MKIEETEFLNYFNNRTFDSNLFNQDGSLNKNYNSFKKTGIIAKIFEDHWDTLEPSLALSIDKYRPYADKEVHKIIDCHNKNLGCSVYECPTCKDIVFVGHTCKSRLCSSCGYKYKNERVESIMQTALCFVFILKLFLFPLDYPRREYVLQEKKHIQHSKEETLCHLFYRR